MSPEKKPDRLCDNDGCRIYCYQPGLGIAKPDAERDRQDECRLDSDTEVLSLLLKKIIIINLLC